MPALIDGHILNNVERTLLSLPGKFGGMGIVIFAILLKRNTKIQEISQNL